MSSALATIGGAFLKGDLVASGLVSSFVYYWAKLIAFLVHPSPGRLRRLDLYGGVLGLFVLAWASIQWVRMGIVPFDVKRPIPPDIVVLTQFFFWGVGLYGGAIASVTYSLRFVDLSVSRRGVDFRTASTIRLMALLGALTIAATFFWTYRIPALSTLGSMWIIAVARLQATEVDSLSDENTPKTVQ